MYHWINKHVENNLECQWPKKFITMKTQILMKYESKYLSWPTSVFSNAILEVCTKIEVQNHNKEFDSTFQIFIY